MTLSKVKHLMSAGIMWTALTWISFSATAQTITIANGVQKYASLASTTVNMSGQCELWVTNSSTPLSGCTINLNSADAWLFLPGVKPSVVVSTYLSQVKVNGAGAVADSNCRVVQYGQSGAVVIPQAPSFQPLQVFSGPYFTGTSAKYSQYTYYTGSGLGAMDANISSFKLKRGYMAVLAQNTGGNGVSQCYVAQDSDLEISVLPAALNDHVRFIYVTPWRWVSKKGTAGDPGISLLNVNWWYDWNIDQNSSRDLEYVAIRQQRWWPSLGQNWQSRGINTVLGYNEPDSSSQANIAVGDAIWSWPDLLGTGLRVGSPAVTDGGRYSWLYPFMQQADTNNLRVDFVAIHYYQGHNPADPSGCASQMYNFLLDVWNHTHRPIWVTEWNNGANWTDSQWPAPTYAQQKADIAAMVQMLDNTPFVERYAIYNWVEDTRAVTTNGVLTGAGVTYRDEYSPIGYRQALPDNGTRSLAQYLFETNTLDSSGYGNNGLAAGEPAYTTGPNGQAVVLDGANNYIQLPPNVASSNNFSFAAWVKWDGGASWQRIFDFGSDTSHYLFLTPSSGGSTHYLRFAINNGGGEQILQTSALPAGQWEHVCVTLNGGTAKLYVNGVLTASSSSFSVSPAGIMPRYNYLGKSQFPADPLFSGSLDDVQIADYAFSAAQVAALATTNLAPQFATNLMILPNGAEGIAYSQNIAGSATDPNPGDTITYSKATGPAWLVVGSDGSLTGTPGGADGGTNYFTVRATDSAGASAFTVVAINVPIIANNGTWIVNHDGLWSTPGNWSGGLVGNGLGYTADFSTLNLIADTTVTLDSSRSIGSLKFGDTSGSQNWTLTSGGGVSLTLDTGSSTSPSIVVSQNTLTNLVSLSGVNGFTKSGTGTLVLGADDSLSGTVNIDTSSTTTAEGNVRVASPGALANATLIQIRDNNNGSSTLQLDGSRGDITIPADVALNARYTTPPAIQNLSGTNVISGAISINVGGSYYTFQSDGGQLGLNGTLSSVAGGTRTLTFQGAGEISVGGDIINGSAATINLVKSGGGTLRLMGQNTYNGPTTINGGALLVDGSLGTNSVAIASDCTLGGSGVIAGPVTLQSGTTLAPGDAIGLLTISNSLTLTSTTTNLFEFDEAQAVNDSVSVSGTLAANSSRIALAINGTLRGGYYRLFNYGTINGSFNPNLIIVSGSVDGVATLDTSVPGQVNLVVSNASTTTGLTPYSMDASTRVLFHFDEAAGGSRAANVGTLGKSAYTVNMSTATTTPPVVTSVLGVPGLEGFGNAANFNTSGCLAGYDANNSGTYDGETVDTISMSALNMGNGGQTPWTLEAMICPAATNANQEIISTDSSAANRGFQFRLNNAGQLELNLIAIGVDIKTAIPSSGPNAFAPNNWYHVAATYNGSNIILYWTKIYPSITAINPISTNAAAIGSSFGSVTGPLVIGNENRSVAGENFQGLIDEARISSVARGAADFLWHPPVPTAPPGLTASAGDAQVGLSWTAPFSATSYNVKRSTANGGAYLTIATVSPPANTVYGATNITYTDVGVTNGVTYYYVISALNADGEGTNSTQVSAHPVSLDPVSLGTAMVAGQMQITWPVDHTGWRLEVQTNNLNVGLGTNWFAVPESSLTNKITLPVDTTKASVFYRLNYPWLE